MNNELTTNNNLSLAISEAQAIILSQATPLEHVRFRKGRGGRQFPYTDTAFVIRTLNQAFGWDWDFEADHEEILYIYPDGIQRPYEVRCRGKLTVRIGDRAISKTQFGSQPLEFLSNTDTPVSLGDAFKGAASDALKKCASLLGIALDLYDSDSPINENPVKAQQQQAQQVKNPMTVEQPKAQPVQKPVESPQKQPVQQSTKAERPLTPAQVKEFSTSRDKWLSAKAPGEKQATYAFTSLSKACEGDDDTRHIVVEYLFGIQSMKDLTAGQCSFIIDWCGAKAENEYTVNEDTKAEIRAIVTETILMDKSVVIS